METPSVPALDTWVWCGHCGAAAWGVPPHGERKPCPLTERKFEREHHWREEVAAADLAKIRAETAYWEHLLEATPPSVLDFLKKQIR